MAVHEVILGALEPRLPAQSFPSQTCAATGFSSTRCHLDVKLGCGKKIWFSWISLLEVFGFDSLPKMACKLSCLWNLYVSKYFIPYNYLENVEVKALQHFCCLTEKFAKIEPFLLTFSK